MACDASERRASGRPGARRTTGVTVLYRLPPQPEDAHAVRDFKPHAISAPDRGCGPQQLPRSAATDATARTIHTANWIPSSRQTETGCRRRLFPTGPGSVIESARAALPVRT